MVPSTRARPVASPPADGLLHEAVAHQILELIGTEAFVPGDRLPAERRLAEQLGVSRVTLRLALGALEADGVLTRSPSRGWFVAGGESVFAIRRAQYRVEGFADYAAVHGLKAHSQVLSSGARAATLQEAEALRVAPGAELFEMRRLRFLDGLVIALEHNRVVLALCPRLVEVDFTEASLYATLRAAEPPQIPTAADYSVGARQANEEERRLLGTDHLVPMLVATQLTYNQDGRPIELTVQSYRSDRYRFQATITDGF